MNTMEKQKKPFIQRLRSLLTVRVCGERLWMVIFDVTCLVCSWALFGFSDIFYSLAVLVPAIYILNVFGVRRR